MKGINLGQSMRYLVKGINLGQSMRYLVKGINLGQSMRYGKKGHEQRLIVETDLTIAIRSESP